MSTLLLTQTINREEDKEYSDILNTVSIDLEDRKTMLSSLAILSQYKQVSEDISSVELNKKLARKKTMKEMMHQSFFHGAAWLGQNYIA